MPFTLGNITLPTPKPGNYQRRTIEVGGSFITLDGTTKRDITARKEQHVIKYEKITQSQVNDILSEYNLRTNRNFSVSEGNLTVGSTPVHIELTDRAYNTGGEGYREDMTLILTEVV